MALKPRTLGNNPLIQNFLRGSLETIRREVHLDEDGTLTVVEIKEEKATGERQRLTYTLTPTEEPITGSHVARKLGNRKKGATP